MTEPRPTRPALILAALAAEPGRPFRCFELARIIGDRVQPTANELARLARRGVVNRTGAESKRIPTYYQHKP